MSELDIQREIEILSSMVSHLTPYIYDDELFGHISNRLPKLTIGAILFYLHRLESLEADLAPQQLNTVQEARAQFEHIRHEWLNHYKEKVQQEIPARLNTILWYLDDCAENPGACDSGWSNQAEKRTIIFHLCQELDLLNLLSPQLRGQIADIDSGLQRYYRKDKFIWDSRLEAGYPRDEFWWLYGRPGAE